MNDEQVRDRAATSARLNDLDPEDRKQLTARRDELTAALADYDKHGQKNMAAILRDDIAWIEAKLGIDVPDQPLVPTREVDDMRRRNTQRMSIVDAMLQNFDELIRHSLDFDGPRKYQQVAKLCAIADKIRRAEMRTASEMDSAMMTLTARQRGLEVGIGDRLEDYGDELTDGDYEAGVRLGANIRPYLGGGNLANHQAAPPTPIQDLQRILVDYLDDMKKIGQDASKKPTSLLDDPMYRLDELLRIRDRLAMPIHDSIPPATPAQLAAIDRRIALALEDLSKDTPALPAPKETSDDSTHSDVPRTRELDHPQLVSAELSRGHSPGGDGERDLRVGDGETHRRGTEGDRATFSDRLEERLVPRRGPRAFEQYQYDGPARADQQGGQAAGEAPAPGSDDDLGGGVQERGDGGAAVDPGPDAGPVDRHDYAGQPNHLDSTWDRRHEI